MQLPVVISSSVRPNSIRMHLVVFFRTAESTASALATLSTGSERRGRLGLRGLLQGGGHGVLRHVQVLAQVLNSLVGQGVVQVLPGIRESEKLEMQMRGREAQSAMRAADGQQAAGPSGSACHRSEDYFHPAAQPPHCARLICHVLAPVELLLDDLARAERLHQLAHVQVGHLNLDSEATCDRQFRRSKMDAISTLQQRSASSRPASGQPDRCSVIGPARRGEFAAATAFVRPASHERVRSELASSSGPLLFRT